MKTTLGAVAELINKMFQAWAGLVDFVCQIASSSSEYQSLIHLGPLFKGWIALSSW